MSLLSLQKYIDQAISRNMYLEEADRANMKDVYMYAWKQGLKGTYYCFIEKKIQGEKYTQSVNKSAWRVWFWARTASTGSSDASSWTEQSEVEGSQSRGFGSRPAAGLSVQVNGLSSTNTTSEVITRESLSDIDLKHATEDDKAKIREMLIQKKWADYVQKLESGELYAQWSCPIDPFEKVMCEACQ
jgi:ribonucleotide reductase alpha subunit